MKIKKGYRNNLIYVNEDSTIYNFLRDKWTKIGFSYSIPYDKFLYITSIIKKYAGQFYSNTEEGPSWFIPVENLDSLFSDEKLNQFSIENPKPNGYKSQWTKIKPDKKVKHSFLGNPLVFIPRVVNWLFEKDSKKWVQLWMFKVQDQKVINGVQSIIKRHGGYYNEVMGTYVVPKANYSRVINETSILAERNKIAYDDIKYTRDFKKRLPYDQRIERFKRENQDYS